MSSSVTNHLPKDMYIGHYHRLVLDFEFSKSGITACSIFFCVWLHSFNICKINPCCSMESKTIHPHCSRLLQFVNGSILLVRDIWVVSRWGSLWTKSLWTFLCCLLMLFCMHFCWEDNQLGFDPKCVWLKSVCSHHDSPPPSSIISLPSLPNTQ